MRTKVRKIFAVLAVFTVFLSVAAILRPIRAAEPNDDFSQAQLITPGTYSGTVDDTVDPNDYYKITVSAGQTIDANATPEAALRISFYLYDSSQSEVLADYPNQGVMAKLSYTTNSAEATSTYYLLVYGASGSGSYTMKVSLISQNDGNSGGDAGDTLDTALQLTSVNATYPGFLKDLDVDDFYKLTVTAGQTLSVNVTPASTLRAWLGLYDPAHNQVVSDFPNQGVMAKVGWTTNSAQANYVYYIEVYFDGGTGGTYSLTVSLASQNDGNSGTDAGDTFDTALQLVSVNATYPGFLKDQDTDDYYKLTVMAGQTLSVNVTPATTLTSWLGLYNPARNMVVSDSPNQGLMAKVGWTTNSAQASYVYYIRVSASAGLGNYTLVTSIVSQNDANSGGDAGDTLDTAAPVTTGTYPGFLKDEDVNDCYKLAQNVTVNQGLFVKVTPSAGQAVGVTLYDEARIQQAYQSANPGVPVVVNTRAIATKIFYIKVTAASGYGNYTLTISKEPSVGVPINRPTAPIVGQDVIVSVNVTAVQNGVGSVVLSYSTNMVSWTDAPMSLNATTGLYDGTIRGFPNVTTVYYRITAYDVAGDYFVQDNAGLYYSVAVVPEFPTLIMALLLPLLSTPVVILFKRRRKSR